jgi:hypothetical protein
MLIKYWDDMYSMGHMALFRNKLFKMCEICGIKIKHP